MSDEKDWINSKDLVKLWYAGGSNTGSLEHKLRPGLRAGLVASKARVAEIERRTPHGRKASSDEADWLVPPEVWKGTGDNSVFDIAQDYYSSRAPGIGFASVKLRQLSFDRVQVLQFVDLSELPTEQLPEPIGTIGASGMKPGPPLDSERWSEFAAALAFIAYTDGLDHYPSRSKLYDAVAQKVSDKGGNPLDEKLVRNMLNTARSWAGEDG